MTADEDESDTDAAEADAADAEADIADDEDDGTDDEEEDETADDTFVAGTTSAAGSRGKFE